jgi:hypothetical protein
VVWVGIGQLTGFGQVYSLPGIWDSLHLGTARRRSSGRSHRAFVQVPHVP